MDSLAKMDFNRRLVDNEFSIIGASLLIDMEWKTEGSAGNKESIYYFYYIHFSIMGE